MPLGQTIARFFITLAAAYGIYKFIPEALPMVQRIAQDPKVIQSEVVEPVGQSVNNAVSSVTHSLDSSQNVSGQTLGITDTATQIVSKKVEDTVNDVQKDIKALPQDAVGEVCKQLIVQIQQSCGR